MFQGLRVAVVMPAFNEEKFVAKALLRVPACVDQIFLVDDASRDETIRVAEATRISKLEIVKHAENRGVGAAIISGYTRAFAEGFDVAVVMAGDAQMDPADLCALVAPIADGTADYVKGNRLAWPDARAHMPAARYWGNRILGWCTTLAVGVTVRDSQCGYTALSRRAADRFSLSATWPRYGYPNDLLARIAAADLRILEVPVRPLYADEASGIGIRHALLVIPFLLMRAFARRITALVFAAEKNANHPSFSALPANSSK